MYLRTVTKALEIKEGENIRVLGLGDRLSFASSLPQPQEEITLETLNAIRTHPEASYWNTNTPSAEILQRELEAAIKNVSAALSSSLPSFLIVDASGNSSKNDGLHRLANALLDKRILVLTGAEPDPSLSGNLTMMQDDLLHKLRFGIPLPDAGGGAATKTKAGSSREKALHDDSFGQSGRIGTAFILLSDVFTTMVEAASRVAVESKAPILLSSSSISSPWGQEPLKKDEAERLVDQILACGVPANRLVLCHLPCQPDLEDYYLRLLQKGIILAFNFQGNTFYSQRAYQYPNDEEGAKLITSLCVKGLASRLLLSQGICCRIQLQRYGGHGFGHALTNVVPRLARLGVTPGDLDLMLRGTAMDLFSSWWTPPPPIEREIEMGKCSWCGKMFEMRENEYYHKFQFIYCRSKCLSKHGDTGWKPIEGSR